MHTNGSDGPIERLGDNMVPDMTIRPGNKKKDLAPVLALLRNASLPIEGVEEHFSNFLVATGADGKLVGAIGMEMYPDGTGLLRSAVVAPSLRNSGIGSLLYDRLMELARTAGIRRVILLTTTAETYFARKGFRKTARTSITGPVTQSQELIGACPDSAICMELLIE